MGEQAPDIVHAQFRERPARSFRQCKSVHAVAFPHEGLVHMPATREDVRNLRLRHERGVVAMAAANLLDGGTEKQRHVGRFKRTQRQKGDLALPRPPLVLDRRDGQAYPDQRLVEQAHQGLDLVAAVFRQVLVAVGQHRDLGRCRRVAAGLGRKVRVLHLEHVKLELEANRHGEAVALELVQLIAQDGPRGERTWVAAAQVGVAQDPSRVLHPRQLPVGRRVRHQHSVRQTDHLRDVEIVLGAKRRNNGMVGRVEQRRDQLEVLARHQAALELGG